ncbi:MAG TPA: polysaccharide pyruvyl transferase family protein [Acidimicrobiales bacterium]
MTDRPARRERPPRIALLGTFDVDNYGDHLFPRVAIQELTRRLPHATVAAYSPFGHDHPTPLDGPVAVEPLGPWSTERVAALAAAHDAVVIGGGEIVHLNDPLLAPVYGVAAGEMNRRAPSRFFVEGLGPAGELSTPTMWHAVGVPFAFDELCAARVRRALETKAYVAVRDPFSRQRLVDAGVEREIAVVPDSALLLPRVHAAADLAVERDRLRAMGRYPRSGRGALVVQGCDLLVPLAREMANAIRESISRHPDLVPVLAATGRARGDATFADALGAHLGRRVFRLPRDSTVEQLAAALSGAAAFVGSSLHGAITAHAYGRPFVLVNAAGEAKLDGFAAVVGARARVVDDPALVPGALDRALTFAEQQLRPVHTLATEIDAHFDRMAELAAAAATSASAAWVSRRSPRVAQSFRELQVASSWWGRRR